MAKDDEDDKNSLTMTSFKWQVIRRARQHGYGGYRTFKLFERSYDLAFYKCFWCDQWIQSEGIEGDHVKPRSQGGSDHINNLVVSCTYCNRSSRNIKDPNKNRQWYKDQRR